MQFGCFLEVENCGLILSEYLVFDSAEYPDLQVDRVHFVIHFKAHFVNNLNIQKISNIGAKIFK
jgi:hypothetical protein